MVDNNAVIDHYNKGDLLAVIKNALAAAGKSLDAVSADDLAPVDEFHIGGRQASVDFIGQLGLGPGDHLLDVGCGIGGPARFAAAAYGCRVTGLDITPAFIQAGRELNGWVGMSDQVRLEPGSALDMPFDGGRFDAVMMLHVGMNIADKAGLFAQAARVVKPGGLFGVYDVMRLGEGALDFPVPWAAGPETSALAAPADYRAAFSAAGFDIIAERDRHGFAVDFFVAMQKKSAAAGGPPPLGVHLLFGEQRAEIMGNMIGNLKAGRMGPVEMIGRRLA